MIEIDPPIALASLSGRSDARWARAADGIAGAAFLGGIALDEPTQAAARAAVARGREEFLTDDPTGFIETQLRRLDGCAIQPGVNVRAGSAAAVRGAAAVCARHDAILEVNAHCRQPECTAIGCGQAMLRRPGRLAELVAAAEAEGAVVSVKVRTEVPGVDLPALAAELDAAGARFVHVDAMDSRGVVADVVGAVGCDVIANNGVRTAADVEEYLGYGAAAVSVGRPSTDPEAVARIAAAAAADGIRF